MNSDYKSWDRFFIDRCADYALKSKDPSRKIGCVIVNDDNIPIIWGYNGFPMGFPDYEELYNSNEKYDYVIHAEANAIAFAARTSNSVKDCTLYCTLHPCSTCAGLIVQAGIKRVVYDKNSFKPEKDDRFGFNKSRYIFDKVGIKYEGI